MKIIVATTSFPTRHSEALSVGGKFILHECRAYQKAGAEVRVIAPEIPGYPRQERFGESVTLHRFPYFFPRRWQRLRNPDGSALYDQSKAVIALQLPFLFIAFTLALLRYGRQADIVHCNWSFTALAALPLRCLFKVPVVLTTRGSDLRLVPKFFNRFICKRIDGAIDCFGPDYRKMLEEVTNNTLTLPLITPEPKAIRDIRADLAAKDEFLVVLVGRFDRTKLELYGMPFFSLIEAIARLAPTRRIRCVHVGDGPLRPAMEARAKALEVDGLVKFVGYQENIYPYVQAADLVAGGVGLNAVSQETAMLGRVQLMPKIRNWYEGIWTDRRNVLLYDPDDDASLLQALKFAIDNPSAIQCIADAVSATREQYIQSVDKGGEIYLGVFRQIVEGYSRTSRA